ncbi:hypothetical protein [Litorilituus sediminis]|uniref:Uncharacterized protein n=1 Tax=Litorilituus sediminis TaxID=718192 RepID=A0A4V0ZGK1_9GAMM|nr:hypothetical protein [Litorilituus sediminis]QBG37580.1 hypothetical protein EMK97_18520 [Litorilituus sediminis]
MKKTNVLTTLITGLIISTSAMAAVPTTEVEKAEPVQQINLVSQAKQTLELSFANIEIKTEMSQVNNKNSLAKQKTDANKNKPVTLTKTTLLAE